MNKIKYKTTNTYQRESSHKSVKSSGVAFVRMKRGRVTFAREIYPE
jgi:hypothetical protein